MKLKKLILHNYKQHPHLEQEFSGNVIGIVGRNGSGKSNLLGGLQFAFAGEQPGFNKTDLLRWGETDGYVKVDFEHAGKPGHIERSLTGSFALFTYGGESYRGITKVSDGIQLHLGLDKDLLKQAIFVRQAEIDNILFEDPRERELAFQKLCGIGDAAKIHKKLGDELAKASTNPINYDEQLAEGHKRYAEMAERMQQLKATAQAVADQHALLPSLSSLQSMIMSYTSMAKTVEQFVKVGAELSLVKGQLSELEGYVDNTPENAADDIAKLDQQLAELDKSIRLAEEYQRRMKTFEDTGKAIMALGELPKPEPLPYTDLQLVEFHKQAEEFQKAFAEVMANKKLYTELLKTLKDHPMTACPVCGGPLSDLRRIQTQAEIYAKQEQTMAASNNPVAQCHQAKALQDSAINRYNQNVRQYNARYAVLIEQFNAAETALQAAHKVEHAITELQAQTQAARVQRSTLVNILRDVSVRQQQRKNCVQRIEQLGAEMNGLQTTIFSMEDVSKQMIAGGVNSIPAYIQQCIGSYNEQIKMIQGLDQQMAQLNGMIRELSNNIQILEATLKTLDDKRNMLVPYNAAVKVLTNVRDWFHYNNGPHTLATAVLAEMNQDVNNFLGQFSAPFSVIQGSDALGFRCIFHDGRQMPSEPPDAHHLSGGQKIQLALSFRFASYCMFASKLGLLSLDEPSTYLDAQNIGAFCTLLERVKCVAKKMDLQILIATHERAVLPFCDSVVDLEVTPS